MVDCDLTKTIFLIYITYILSVALRRGQNLNKLDLRAIQ